MLDDVPSQQFLIIGIRGDREIAFRGLKELWPEVTIFSPVEKRLLRPRRRSSKKEAVWVERPLFLNYVAVSLEEGWERLFRCWWFQFVLGNDGKPVVLNYQQLQGMVEKAKQRSWEGEMVELVSGPFEGKRGVYEKGKVRGVTSSGVPWKAKAGPFDAILVE